MIAEIHTGTRKMSYEQTRQMENELRRRWARKTPALILTGGAKGADTNADTLAWELGIKRETHRPDYAKHAKGAPLKRNTTLIERGKELAAQGWPVTVIAWKPNGASAGTDDTIRKALAAGLTVEEWDGESWTTHNPRQLTLTLE